MKKLLSVLALTLFLASCNGTSDTNQENESQKTEISAEESDIVKKVTKQVDQDIEQIKKKTNEELKDVDSLLKKI